MYVPDHQISQTTQHFVLIKLEILPLQTNVVSDDPVPQTHTSHMQRKSIFSAAMRKVSLQSAVQVSTIFSGSQNYEKPTQVTLQWYLNKEQQWIVV